MADLAASQLGVSERANAPTFDREFRLRIRDATAESHATLDRMLGQLDLRSAPEYRKFLSSIASALIPLETAMTRAGAANVIPDWHRRMRSAAILADLSKLKGVHAPLPVTFDLCRPGILGAAYVLEGSRLGAKILVKQVLESNDPRVCSATLYLSHGAAERYWPSFVSVLNQGISTLTDEQEAIATAQKTFALFAAAVQISSAGA